MAIHKELITDIKNQTNIVEVIGEFVPLVRSGRNYLGRCPFHKEKTPSFNVVEDKQFYHCFGCGKSGDVFHFLEEYRQISFNDSVKILAERLGMRVDFGDEGRRPHHPHQELYDIHTEASNFYHAILMTTRLGQLAKDYLYQRGLTDELINYFKIGLAPEQADYLYQKVKGQYSEETIFNSGLFQVSNQGRVFDSFQNRIMFPLTDDQGRVIAFSGRIWSEKDSQQAKYKNTRKTSIFNKSYELYHLDRAKAVAHKTKELYLMEGFMDVIAAYRAGLENSVASMGTALTSEHVNHLRRYSQKLVLVYDGDGAGQEAIAKSLALLEEMSVEIVRLPQQMDPDEFIQKNSPEQLAELLTHSRISKIEFFLHYYLPVNLDNLQAQLAYVEQMAPIITEEKSVSRQDIYIHQLADLLPSLNYKQVELVVNQERLKKRQTSAKQMRRPESSQILETSVIALKSPLLRAEMHLFHRLLHHPSLLAEFKQREDLVFQTPELAQLYLILKEQGSLEPNQLQDLGLSEQESQMYYAVLAEHLPDEIADDEIAQLKQSLRRYHQGEALNRQGQKIRDFSGQGDDQQVLAELAKYIAQKRQMEKEEL
ncbi:DNA primase [Streptococcus cuniculipharyngis]|uniref:DNA primase n=1 Tax=Streptococcus cuniculipharyngis TaxID=1562651 RepID=A0A5C5SD00_9STRE|nr:DNA primase [Streptococcus cuniculipharyngis]TWS98967.1 DNA primase [Streptococcus cuniculipharyngis]